MADPGASERILTWRDGVLLTTQEKAALSPEQWRHYSDDSVVRHLSEIHQMPEPLHSWRAEPSSRPAPGPKHARIAEEGSRKAS
jgi:hypothetical protein